MNLPHTIFSPYIYKQNKYATIEDQTKAGPIPGTKILFKKSSEIKKKHLVVSKKKKSSFIFH